MTTRRTSFEARVLSVSTKIGSLGRPKDPSAEAGKLKITPGRPAPQVQVMPTSYPKLPLSYMVMAPSV